MIVIAPSHRCTECGKPHQLTRISIFLYLCEPHAREIARPSEVLDSETMEALREAFGVQGFEDIDFAGAIWEFAPLPVDVAIRPN